MTDYMPARTHIDVREAAALIDPLVENKEAWVQRRLRAGWLRAVKVSGKWRIPIPAFVLALTATNDEGNPLDPHMRDLYYQRLNHRINQAYREARDAAKAAGLDPDDPGVTLAILKTPLCDRCGKRHPPQGES